MRSVRRLRTIPLSLSVLGSAIAVLHALTPAVLGSVAVADTQEATFESTDQPLGPSPSLEVNGATAAERAVTEWAIDRFDLAGLTLPNITLHFRGDHECGGAAGLYRHATATVTVCNRGGHDNPPRQVLLHELAHAWSLHTMDDGDIAEFLADQDLDDWIDSDAMYWRQGAERVAEYVAWGLQDSADEERSIWTYGKACDDLADAFRLVTGSEPLNASPGYCETA